MSFFTDRNRVRAREIVAQYPHAKSAILPLAHLAQDQAGWLSDEAMAEIAELTDETPANVLGTCSFYTMFKRRPCGRLLVSVCTNVTCLVTGGPEILEHLEHDVLDGRRGRSRGGRVHRRVRRRAGHAGQLRVPREAGSGSARPTSSSSTSAVTSRPARSRARSSGARRDISNGATFEETRIVTKRLYERPDDSWTIDGALASGCYDALREVLAQGDPKAIQEQVTKSGLRGPGRRELRHRPEVVVPPRRRAAALPRRQRRRRRALHVQGPHARRARSSPVDRRAS